MLLGYRISIIIPCYNEELAIRKVLGNIPNYIDEVIVVDNNSTDNSAKITKKYGARLLFEKKQGYGYALRKGISQAKSQLIVTMDGDNTYNSKSIKSLVYHLHKEKLDFVSGNRFNDKYKNSIHIINLIGNIILTQCTKILFQKKILDSQSGMMLFRKKILPHITIHSGGMSFSEEIKLRTLMDSSFKFDEYSILYKGKDRLGEKKLHLWRDGIKNIIFLFRIRFGL